ncbi:MAG: serine/threonine protein kinase [Candidatus Melainabacteria bacterium]|nr:serine/threonine protein kinase [Candidatus Melainabacteria bacterium]
MTEKQSKSQENLQPGVESSPGGSLGGTGSSTWIEETAVPVVLEPGSVVLDKYKIVELVGLGGMGSVFRVTHVHLGTVYALKCLNKEQPKDASWRRFQNEAKAAHILDHPNLIKVHDFGLLPGRRPYFVMDFVDGTTVADEVQRLGRLPVLRCLRIFIQVAFAIAHAHENGVIHRDLKSSNIMVVKSPDPDHPEDELVRIVDFGIAKLTGADEFNQQTLTKTGEIFGSPLYMSPEQCMGLVVDSRSDLYSLGCMLYEALTGAPPFIGESALATMMKHQSEPPLSLKQASMGIDFPVELERIVAKLLEKDPSARYQNGSLLAQDLINLESKLKSRTAESGTLEDGTRSGNRTAYEKKGKSIFSGNPIGQGVIAAVSFLAGMGVTYFLLQSELEAAKTTKAPVYIPPAPVAATPALDEKPFSHIDPATKERVFDFPKTTIGSFIFSDQPGINCVNVKRIPQNRLIGFNPTYAALSKFPNLLKKFAPDDLTLLYLSRNEASTRIFNTIPHLTGLKAINVKFTDFSDNDFKYLDALPNLSYLNVSYANVSGDGIAKLKYLNKLTSLHSGSIPSIQPVLKAAPKIPNLYQLSLHADQLDDNSLADISKCAKLRALSVGSNRSVTDNGVKHLLKLKQLKYLDLSGTAVTMASLPLFKQMPQLKELVIPLGMTDRSDVEILKKALPRVKLTGSSPDSNTPPYCLDFDWKGEGL